MGGVTLLEEVYHCEGGLQGLNVQVRSSVAFTSAVCRSSSFSSIMSAYVLPAIFLAMTIMDYTFETVNQPHLNVSLKCCGHGFTSQQ